MAAEPQAHGGDGSCGADEGRELLPRSRGNCATITSTPHRFGVAYVVIALGSNVHIFARPRRRAELAACFEMVLRSPPYDPVAVLQAARAAGLTEVKHPGHPYYFMIPGGQVFTTALTS